MDSTLQLSQALHDNLKLLGFEDYLKKRKSPLELQPDIFNKPHLKNYKMFESVTHFLFYLLNSKECQEKFRDCWPSGDDKKKESDFRKMALECLRQLEKKPKANFPRILPVHFQSPGGESFCHLYLAFSNYVMMKLIDKEFPDILAVDLDSIGENELLTAIQSNLDENEKIKAELESRVDIYQSGFDYLTQRHADLKQQVQEAEDELSELVKRLKEQLKKIDNEQETDEKKNLKQEDRDFSQSFTKFCSEAMQLWEKVERMNDQQEASKSIIENVTANTVDVRTNECRLNSNEFEQFLATIKQSNKMLESGQLKDKIRSMSDEMELINNERKSYRQQWVETFDKLKALIEDLKQREQQKREELLKHPKSVERRNKIKERITNLKVDFNIHPNKVQKQHKLNGEIKDAKTKAEKLSADFEEKYKFETPKRTVADYSFHAADVSTYEYIAPNQESDDSMFSPIREVSEKEG